MRKSVLFAVFTLGAIVFGGIFNYVLAFPSLTPSGLSQNLTPLPEGSYQVARSIFLPDYKESPFSGDELDNDYNQIGNCDNKDDLYTTKNCSYPYAVLISSQCINLPGYYTECVCLPQFQYTSCTPPYILSGDSCDGKYEKCGCPATVDLTNENDKCTQYCDGKCISKSCTPLANQTGCTNGQVNCDDGCGGTTRKCCAGCIASAPARGI